MKVGFYLTFKGNCSQAFDFYKKVFGGEFSSRMTWGDSPCKDQVPKEQQDTIMHISLPIRGGQGVEDFSLMGSEYMESMMSQPFVQGNNTQIILTPASHDEADKIFAALSEGGVVESPMENQFWGSYHGSFTDAFGIRWMIDCASTKGDQDQEHKDIAEVLSTMRHATKTSMEAVDRLTNLFQESPFKKTKH